MQQMIEAPVRVGIGGWTFKAWRNDFYPAGLPQKGELEYASHRLTSIEINATYYASQKPASFLRWRDEVPPGFVFAVKGPRYATNKRLLAEAGAAIERFFGSGVMELEDKLGPINWQFMPTRQFDPTDFEAFLKMLPRRIGARCIRHAIEVRHRSFAVPAFIELLRAYGVALVFSDREGVPEMYDLTAPFVYLRLQRASAQEQAGYTPQALQTWAKRARTWSRGGAPEGLCGVASLDGVTDPGGIADSSVQSGSVTESKPGTGSGPAPEADAPAPREVFVYMINGFKPKAPAAAAALIEQLRVERCG